MSYAPLRKRQRKPKPLKEGDLAAAEAVTYESIPDGEGGSRRVKVPLTHTVVEAQINPPAQEGGSGENSDHFETMYDHMFNGDHNADGGADIPRRHKVCYFNATNV